MDAFGRGQCRLGKRALPSHGEPMGKRTVSVSDETIAELLSVQSPCITYAYYWTN
jgi:hypothetical protein